MVNLEDGTVFVPDTTKPQKASKTSPFDFVNAITFSKEDLMVDEAQEKQYTPFVVNRALSFSQDAILLANEMNKYPNLDHRLQFDFLRSIIRKRKRYEKWQKYEEPEKIQFIKTFYKYSTVKAMEVAPLLTDEALARMKDRMSTGGLRDGS